MAFLKMGDDLTSVAQLQADLARAREENRELDAALTAANLRVAELEEERDTIMDISQDCDGTATTPVEAFNELIRAFKLAVADRADLGKELRKLRTSQRGDGESR